MKPWIIVDLDGTLADVEHRRKWVLQEPRNWDEWNARIDFDTVHDHIRQLVKLFYNNGTRVAIVTGRFNKFRNTTINWLDKHAIPWDELHMRPDGDYRSDHEVKQDILTGLRKGQDRFFMMALDDRDSVVKMWRANGIPCLQVAEGAF